MGVTIAYRGRLADLDRIEDFEDRLVDCALDLGALVQVWRSWDDDDPKRMVRGVILGLAPGLESTSLLVSPEGWLIGLVDIEDAEKGLLKEAPWCFTKTQFGPIEAHVTLVELLAALKREFLPELEVSDEGGYWETHDLAELARRISLIGRAIDGLAQGLQRYGISSEAAEDPNILMRHIERVAELVHRNLRRPSEHAPIDVGDDDLEGAADPAATEKLWDAITKENRRKQERIVRAIEERRSSGQSAESAIRDALREVVPELPDDEVEPSDHPWRNDDDRPLEESLGDPAAIEDAGFDERDDDSFEVDQKERHPLLQKAMDLFVRLDSLVPEEEQQSSPALHLLYQGAGDACGGLAQALSGHEFDSDDYGLRVSQLKRALRGAAFARGALFPLRSSIGKETFDELFGAFKQMETDIVSELSQLRSLHSEEES